MQPQDSNLIWIQAAIVEYGKSRTWILAHCKTVTTIDRRDYVKRSEIEAELQPKVRSTEQPS